MSPEHLKAISLFSDLSFLFEQAKDKRNYRLNALPEEEVVNFLVERLSPVLIEAEDLIEKLATRSSCRRRVA